MEREITKMVVVLKPLKKENMEGICKKGEKCRGEKEGKITAPVAGKKIE